MTAFLRTQHRQGRADDIQRTEEVRFDIPADLIVITLLHRADESVARVIHQHVKASRFCDGLANVRRVGHIERQHAAGLAFEIGDAAHITCRGDDTMPGGQRRLCDGTAKAARTAGDKPCFHVLSLQRVKLSTEAKLTHAR